MATIQIEAFVTWRMESYWDEPRYELYAADMSICGPQYVFVGTQTVTVEIPDDFDPRPKQIESLRKMADEIRAEAHVKVTNIEEQIQRLLCLEAPTE